MKINQCEVDSAYVRELESLFKSEWGDFSFEKYDSALPLPLVAIFDGKVVGGLAFTFYPHPKQKRQSLWINALYVLPEYRRQAIAKQLIERSVLEVPEHYDELFAYTHVFSLYEGLGWLEIEAETEPKHKVMSLNLGKNSKN